MKRKIISMWMAIVLLLTTVDVSVFASEATVSENREQNVSSQEVELDKKEEESVSSNLSDNTTMQEVTFGPCGDNLTWSYENGTLTITGTGDMWNYGGEENPYTPWYGFRENITQLVLDDNITRIGCSFSECSNLKGNLKFPDKITVIQAYTFSGCTGLSGLEIPGSVKIIEKGAFEGCTGLSGTLIIPEGVTVIGEWAFKGCSGLTGLEIPDGMRVIEDDAFAYCEGIETIRFHGAKPESLGSLDFENPYIFAGITADVYYPANDSTWEGIESLEGIGGDLTWIAYEKETQPEEPDDQETRVTAPVANIESGSRIQEETIIRLTSETLDSQIYYTTDGTKPVAEDGSPRGKLYTDGIIAKKVMQPVKNGEAIENLVIIKAYAMKKGTADSKVVTFKYAVEAENSRWGDIVEQDRKLYATEQMPQGDASKVPAGLWVAGIKEEGYLYSGNNIVFTPNTEEEIRVYDGKTLLKLNQDYTISYKNNKKAYSFKEGDGGYAASKAPTVTIKTKGNYSGSIVKTFIINPLNLEDLKNDGTTQFQAPDITLAYNGNVQKGTTKVTYTDVNGKVISLKANTDFTYVYPGTDSEAPDYKEGAFKVARKEPYEVSIVGKGNYTGTITFQETITERVLISKVKVEPIPAQNYNNGESLQPGVTLTYKGKTLTAYDENTKTGDYTVEYKDNYYPGTASVVIRGMGEFAGERVVTFKIQGIDLKKLKMEGFVPSYIYTGDPIEQSGVKFIYETDSMDKPLELLKDIDYTVKYDKDKNVNVGTVTVIYTGNPKKGYTGTIKKTFKIKPYDLNSDIANRMEVTDEYGNKYPQNVSYVKGGAKPTVKMKYTSPEGTEYILKEGTDYKLSYTNNKNVNDGKNEKKIPTIKITGKGNFSGTRQKETFKIAVSDISQMSLTAADVVYQNKKDKFTTKVVITDIDGKKLSAGKDYEKSFQYYYGENVTLANGEQRMLGAEVAEDDIVPVGTILKVVVTGKGNYAGSGEKAATISDLYRVVGADIAKAKIKVNKQYYTGKPICPNKSQIVITMNGKVLSSRDYQIVSYANNTNKGTAKLTVKGVGSYGGTKTVNFTIANKTMDCIISFNANGATSGSMKDMKIKYGTDYTLTKNTYKKDGYDFKGWNTEYDGTGVDAQGNAILYEDEAKNPISISKNDIGKIIILYAKWELTEYEIKYELNGGTNHEQNPAMYMEEDEVELKEPTKEGYVFLGWYTDSSFSESKKITSIAKGTKGNKVFYAKWRETSIGKVEVPEEYLNVLDFGACPDDETNDTKAFYQALAQASVNAGKEKANTVYVPAGVYRITPTNPYSGDSGIYMRSNTNLVMDNNAILYVESSSSSWDCVIKGFMSENITISGGKIQGERHRHSGTGGESAHGINFLGCSNITISNMSIASNWGDGIYLGTWYDAGSDIYTGTKDVTISHCEITDNRRNNISIVDADNVLIDSCYIADAHGTAPQCGICIEPNKGDCSGDEICSNITIRNTTITAYKNKNAVDYWCFMTTANGSSPEAHPEYVTADTIRFEKCTFNGYVGNYSGNNLTIDKDTVFHGTFVSWRKYIRE